MRSPLQETFIVSLGGILRPIVSLCVRCGIGFNEFSSLARSAFVTVVTDEYGLRGRPANASRVAAMTGISRKEIRKIRDELQYMRWTPAMEISPINLLLHYWHYDDDFSVERGVAAPLAADGDLGFSALVRRYAGDIPAGALKEALKSAGVVQERDGIISVCKRYFQPMNLDKDFIQNISLSISNLAGTVVHNAKLVARDDFSEALSEIQGRFERFAWSDQLSEDSKLAFRAWVRKEGEAFIERADHWIGENEDSKDLWRKEETRTIGVGLYFFEED